MNQLQETSVIVGLSWSQENRFDGTCRTVNKSKMCTAACSWYFSFRKSAIISYLAFLKKIGTQNAILSRRLSKGAAVGVLAKRFVKAYN